MRLDFPDFLHDELAASLGRDFEPVLAAMQARAPVDLRVNSLKTNPDAATVVLARDGVQVARHPLAATALRVLDNPRLVAASRAYTSGMVELQDASSQVVAEIADARPGMTVLDYCAGGGGKTLALAAAMRGRGRLLAWDANPRRMADLPDRARRAGAAVRILSDAEVRGARSRSATSSSSTRPARAPAPGGASPRASGGSPRPSSPATRRCRTRSSTPPPPGCRPGGRLVYATCSLLARENEDRAAGFAARHPAGGPTVSAASARSTAATASSSRPSAPRRAAEPQPPAHLRTVHITCG